MGEEADAQATGISADLLVIRTPWRWGHAEIARHRPSDRIQDGSACLRRGCMSRPGSTPIRVVTARLSLAPSSFTRYPVKTPYGVLSRWEGHGLTTFRV